MREKGSTSYSGNFEVQKSAPLDSRSVVTYYADLFDENNWKSYDGESYTYAGMLTTVCNDPDTTKNGVYKLNGVPATVESNWVRVGSELIKNEKLNFIIPEFFFNIEDGANSATLVETFGVDSEYEIVAIIESWFGYKRYYRSIALNGAEIMIELREVLNLSKDNDPTFGAYSPHLLIIYNMYSYSVGANGTATYVPDTLKEIKIDFYRNTGIWRFSKTETLSSGGSLATDEEYIAGTITNKAPNVVQVKNSINNVNENIALVQNEVAIINTKSLPGNFILLSDEDGQNLNLTYTGQIINIPLFNGVTSKSELITVEENIIDIGTDLEKGQYYLYYDNFLKQPRVAHAVSYNREDTFKYKKVLPTLDTIWVSSNWTATEADFGKDHLIDGLDNTVWYSGAHSNSTVVGQWLQIGPPPGYTISDFDKFEIHKQYSNYMAGEVISIRKKKNNVESEIGNVVFSLEKQIITTNLVNIDADYLVYKPVYAPAGVVNFGFQEIIGFYMCLPTLCINQHTNPMVLLRDKNVYTELDALILGTFVMGDSNEIISVLGSPKYSVDASTDVVSNLEQRLTNLESRLLILEG